MTTMGARRRVRSTFASVVLAVLGVLSVLAVSGCGVPVSASEMPTGERPAEAVDLVGRWEPTEGGGRIKPFVEFAADGKWVGSDGCNGQRGTWAIESGGAFRGTAGPSTKIFCDNVQVERWMTGAARAVLVYRQMKFDGPGNADAGPVGYSMLELRGPDGAVLGRMMRT